MKPVSKITGKINELFVPSNNYIFDSAILLKGMFADNSCILGHVASLCERDMTLVAMGLLRVAILLSSGTVKNQRYVIFIVVYFVVS